MIIEIRPGNVHNPEGVKYVIPSGFCSVTAYLFYNHINPSDFNCVTHTYYPAGFNRGFRNGLSDKNLLDKMTERMYKIINPTVYIEILRIFQRGRKRG